MKSKRSIVGFASALMAAAGIFWLVNNSRAATETPAYKVVRAEGKFEVRDYPSLTVAGTAMEGNDMNGGFRRLFRFITGGNATAEKIAMTSPVLVDSAPEKRTMSFIMPRKTVQQGVPAPAAENVALQKLEAGRFATFRFGGSRSRENEARALARLREWLDAQGLAAKGAPLFAYYDPPWTPVFLRRNEVMIRLAK